MITLANWQTPAALTVVALTVIIFVVRFALKKRSDGGEEGCGSGCDCAVKPGAPPGRKHR